MDSTTATIKKDGTASAQYLNESKPCNQLQQETPIQIEQFLSYNIIYKQQSYGCPRINEIQISFDFIRIATIQCLTV